MVSPWSMSSGAIQVELSNSIADSHMRSHVSLVVPRQAAAETNVLAYPTAYIDEPSLW